MRSGFTSGTGMPTVAGSARRKPFAGVARSWPVTSSGSAARWTRASYCWGRSTWQLFSRLWPGRDDPFSARMNAVRSHLEDKPVSVRWKTERPDHGL